MVIGRSPDRSAGTSGLTNTTNGLRPIDIVDKNFSGRSRSRQTPTVIGTTGVL
jgi:hypothetical protein